MSLKRGKAVSSQSAYAMTEAFFPDTLVLHLLDQAMRHLDSRHVQEVVNLITQLHAMIFARKESCAVTN